MKNKIAISISGEILQEIDKIIDGTSVRSRSQAIEILIKKGLGENVVDMAVLLYSKEHEKIAGTKFKESTVLEKQIDFLRKNGINKIYVLTQGTIEINSAEILKTKEKNNGDALRDLKSAPKDSFVVMSGDTFNNFDLHAMINKHLKSGKLATIGLMSSPVPVKYGNAILEGDLVMAFSEKPKIPTSHIVNSGIYIFKQETLAMMKGSIERNVLPELAKKRELIGYFTMGEYIHFGEKN